MSNSGSSSDVESSSLTGWQQSSPAQSAAATKLPPIFGILNGANWCLSPSPGSSQDYAHNLSWFSYVFLANLARAHGPRCQHASRPRNHLPSTIYHPQYHNPCDLWAHFEETVCRETETEGFRGRLWGRGHNIVLNNADWWIHLIKQSSN